MPSGCSCLRLLQICNKNDYCDNNREPCGHDNKINRVMDEEKIYENDTPLNRKWTKQFWLYSHNLKLSVAMGCCYGLEVFIRRPS